MPAPAPTELLNQDIGRLASAIDNLAAKFDENSKYQRDFNLNVTKELGEIRTEMGSLRLDMTKQSGEIRTEMGTLRLDMSQQSGEIRTEMGTLRLDMSQQSGEIRTEMESLRLDMTKQLGQMNTKMESLNLDMTKEFGEINTKMGSVTTTLRIAGTIVSLVAGVALTLGVTSYQQLWSAGKREGILETKVDIMATRLYDHLRNPNHPSGDRSTPPALPEDKESIPPPPRSKIGPVGRCAV